MRFWLSLAVAILFLVDAAPSRADWHEAKSKHFLIYADERPDDLRAFAERLERFDQSVRTAINADDPPVGDGNRLSIYVMPSVKDVQKLVGDTSGFIAGFYSGRARGSLAYVAEDAGDTGGESVFFHEYTHHLMMQQIEMPYPEWYVEGFAEFFSTPKFDRDGSVWLGAPLQNRAYSLFNGEQVPVQALLGSTYGPMASLPKDKREAVYGRSWLLSHFLLMKPERHGQLSRYVVEIARGVPLLQAAQNSFGDLGQLEREVDSYRNKRLLQFKIPAESIHIGPIHVAPLGDGAAQIVLARGSLKFHDDRQTAERILPQLRSVVVRYPRDELILTTLAEAELEVGNAAAAEAVAIQASNANPRNTEALVLRGRAILERASDADNPQRHALFEQARDAFIAANKIDSEDPEPLMEFYRAFVQEGVKPTDNALAALHYASNLAPQDLGLRLNSATAYLTEGKLKDARMTLAPIAYSPHGGKISEVARKMMALIDSGAEPKSILRAALGNGRR